MTDSQRAHKSSASSPADPTRGTGEMDGDLEAWRAWNGGLKAQLEALQQTHDALLVQLKEKEGEYESLLKQWQQNEKELQALAAHVDGPKVTSDDPATASENQPESANRQDCSRLGHLFGPTGCCMFCGLRGPAGLDCRSLHRRLGLMAEAMVSAKVGQQARFFTRERVDEIVLLLREAEKRMLEGR